jgi:heparan-alpha-glucosaminide N-acetyltransferase
LGKFWNLLLALFLLQIMILVDDAGGVYPSINHAPWDGITLADFVMPFFLFIIGVAMAIVFKVSIP